MGSCASVCFKGGRSQLHSGNLESDLIRSRCTVSCAVAPSSAIPEKGEILQSPNLKTFPYNELKSATRNFRPESMLGKGLFGCVYKGWVDEHSLTPTRPGTGKLVAVKILNQMGAQGHQEWLAEIKCLGQLYHPNLVKLIGYCTEDEDRLLVYEFMPKGSLENHLFTKNSQPLPWNVRMNIALGAAKGLEFLHNEAKLIHRDFKTSNILLDSNYNAKLSDFGLATDRPSDSKSHVTTRVLGTQGYLAPEYIDTGHLNTKTEVYSFGVVLLELLSGRRAVDEKRAPEERILVDWARPYLSSRRRIYQVLDVCIDGQCQCSSSCMLKAMNLANQCLSIDAQLRPNMEDVVKTLEELCASSNNEGHVRSSKHDTRRKIKHGFVNIHGRRHHRSREVGEALNGGVAAYATPSTSPRQRRVLVN